MQAKAEPQPFLNAFVTDVFAIDCSATASAMSSSYGNATQRPMRKQRLGTAKENGLLTDRRFDGIAAPSKKGLRTQSIFCEKLRGKIVIFFCYAIPA